MGSGRPTAALLESERGERAAARMPLMLELKYEYFPATWPGRIKLLELILAFFLHRLLRPCSPRQPALVPRRGRHQLARHHLLLPLLPLPGRAAQQAADQLADGGVLVHSWGHIFLLHCLRLSSLRLCGLRGRGVAVLDRREHRCWSVWSVQWPGLRWWRLSHLHGLEGQPHRLCGSCTSHRLAGPASVSTAVLTSLPPTFLLSKYQSAKVPTCD